MKDIWNKRYTVIAIYAFLVTAAAMLLLMLLLNFSTVCSKIGYFLSVLSPFIWGGVFAFVLNPLLSFIEKKVLMRVFKKTVLTKRIRAVSLFFTYVIFFGILALLFMVVLPQMMSSISTIVSNFPTYVTAVQQWMIKTASNFHLTGNSIDYLNDFVNTASDLIFSRLTSMVPTIISTTTKIMAGILRFAIGIIVGIYMLFNKEKFFAQINRLAHAVLPERIVHILVQIVHTSDDIFTGFISGKILDSAIIGIICFIVMIVFKWPYAVLISVIVGITNVIPYFGPFIGAVPSALIILTVSPLKAFWFCIFILILQQFDGNILGPKILGSSTGLSAMWVIFAITVFSAIFGIIGMFIGVPLFAVIYSICKDIIHWRLDKKGMPVESDNYASEENPILR